MLQAVVTDVLEPGEVSALRADVEAILPREEIDMEQSTVRHAFAEFSPVARSLLLHKKYIDIQMLLLGVTPGVNDDELTLHRSAAIVRRPGAGKGGASSPWHSDFTGYEPLPLMNASVHLNRGEAPNGKWCAAAAVERCPLPASGQPNASAHWKRHDYLSAAAGFFEGYLVAWRC